MPPARIVLKALILVLAAICGVAAVAAQGGRWSAHLDILTHFAPIYLAVGVLMMIVAIFLRMGRERLVLALLGGAAAIGGMALIVPAFTAPASPTTRAGGPGQIKVIQFNVGDQVGDSAPIVGWIVQQNPDVLVLEEASPALRHAIQRVTGGHLVCGLTCEVAIVSRASPARVERPNRGYYGLGPAIAVTHYSDDVGEFSVVGVHYVWPTRVAIHRENTSRMLKLLLDRPLDRLIMVGDFNSTPWSFARKREEAALGLERRTRVMFTWPTHGLPGFPILPIDHVYAGRGWRTVEVTRGPKLGGDHYPVVTILAPAR